HLSLYALRFLYTPPPPPLSSTLSLHDALPIYLNGSFEADALCRRAPGRYGKDGKFVKRTSAESGPDGPGNSVTTRRSPGAFSRPDRKSTRLNSSHRTISYAVFCLKKKKTINKI